MERRHEAHPGQLGAECTGLRMDRVISPRTCIHACPPRSIDRWIEWHEDRRGTPALDLPPAAFINFLQNHDQVANSARGDRIHRLTSPGQFRALTALLLLGPATPMLFMGQEFASSAPFLYFGGAREPPGRLAKRTPSA